MVDTHRRTPDRQSGGRRWYVLGILSLVGMLNLVDRQILIILIEPIKHDLRLSDTQIGLLTGVTFAFVYAVGGLWLARVADRFSRPLVIAGAVMFWSVMTACGGLAGGFWQLAASRLGVAVGEAGSAPATHGLIAELFPSKNRALAIAIFATATPIGVMVGYGGGGWLAAALGWRSALVCVGTPGLLLGAFVALTVRVPGQPHSTAQTDGSTAIAFLLARPTYRHIIAGATLYAAWAYGLSAFQPSFLVRTHGFSIVQAGLWLGLITGLAGGAGTLLGGFLADRLGRRDVRWRQFVPAVGALAAAPFTLMALFVRDGHAAVLLLAVPSFGGLLYFAPSFGVVQSLAPPWARATASAMVLLVLSLVGQSTGPLLIGMTSDALSVTQGPSALRLALCAVIPIQLWSAYHFYRAGQCLKTDLALCESRHQEKSSEIFAPG